MSTQNISAETVFRGITEGNDLGFSEPDIQFLLNYQFTDGSYLLPSDDPYALYQNIYTVLNIGVDIIDLLKNYQNTRRVFMVSNPLMESKYRESQEQMNTMLYDVFVGGGSVKCPRCKSERTTIRYVQIRSADEGQSSVLSCYDCNFTTVID